MFNSSNATTNSLHHILNPNHIRAQQGINPPPTEAPPVAPPVQATDNAKQQQADAVAAQKARLHELGLNPHHLTNFKNRINAYTHSRQLQHLKNAINNLTGLSPEARTCANELLQLRRTEISVGGKGKTVVKRRGGEYESVLVDVLAFEIGKRGVAAVKAGVCGRMGRTAAVGAGAGVQGGGASVTGSAGATVGLTPDALQTIMTAISATMEQREENLLARMRAEMAMMIESGK